VSNRNAGALSNGLLARPVSGVVGIASTTTADAIGSASAGAGGQSNRALLSMPSVVAVDHETSSIIESETGSASTGQLFNIGHGRVIAANGALQLVTFYSHFNNDTVITSQGKNFEISAGAQMQMLVGVNKK
jgi:DNA-binding beta-propeller fold protein YncE